MAYKVKKGSELCRFGGAIKDGREKINILLGDATQEQLEEIYLLGLTKHIEKTTKGKPKKKKRDNNKNAPLPTLKDEQKEA